MIEASSATCTYFANRSKFRGSFVNLPINQAMIGEKNAPHRNKYGAEHGVALSIPSILRGDAADYTSSGNNCGSRKLNARWKSSLDNVQNLSDIVVFSPHYTLHRDAANMYFGDREQSRSVLFTNQKTKSYRINIPPKYIVVVNYN